MRKLEKLLFGVLPEKDEIVMLPVCFTIPTFKKLYSEDKSDNKELYTNALGYIYHSVSTTSPFFGKTNKKNILYKEYLDKFKLRDMGKGTTYLKLIEEACDIMLKHNFNTPQRRSLDLAIDLNDSIRSTVEALKSDQDNVQNLLKDINEAISKEKILDNKISLTRSLMDIQTLALNNTDKMGKIIVQLKTNVMNIEELYKEVLNAEEKEEEKNVTSITEFVEEMINKFS